VAVDGVGGGPEPFVEETLSSLKMPPPPAPAARAVDADVAAGVAAGNAAGGAYVDAAKYDHAMEVVRGRPGWISAKVVLIRTEVLLDTGVIVRSSTRSSYLSWPSART